MLYQCCHTGQEPYPDKGANIGLTSSIYLLCVFFQVAEETNICENLLAGFPNLLSSVNSWRTLQKERYTAVKGVLITLFSYVTQRSNTMSSNTRVDPRMMS